MPETWDVYWSNIATIATPIVATIGFICLGLQIRIANKQAKITQMQSKIQQQQAETVEKQKLLMERQMEIEAAVRESSVLPVFALELAVSTTMEVIAYLVNHGSGPALCVRTVLRYPSGNVIQEPYHQFDAIPAGWKNRITIESPARPSGVEFSLPVIFEVQFQNVYGKWYRQSWDISKDGEVSIHTFTSAMDSPIR